MSMSDATNDEAVRTEAPSSAALRAELARAGRGQADVADWLNIKQPAVSKRMTGRIEWRLAELRIIATRLGIPLSRLVEDEPAGQVSA